MSDSERPIRQSIAHYRLLRTIGSGGMAVVYLAEDTRHQRSVAVKVLRPELAASLGQQRFLREITTTAGLRHPHILPLYDSGCIDGSETEDGTALVYYVMPFVEGESLRDRLRREKQLPVQQAVRITREVADALDYAHGRGVIHRDVKPANILLEGSHAVVADFGIAEALNAAGATRLTATGLALGTPAYMSPEQLAGERDLDGRSDLYSLGCALYEMLAGQPPFNGPTIESIARQHLVVEVPPVTQLRPAVPPALATCLARALQKQPADRFDTVGRFADAIGAVSETAPSPAEPRAIHPHGSRAPRRAIAAAAVVAAVAAGLLWQMLGAGSFWHLSIDRDRRWLYDEVLPAIEEALDVADWESAYALARQIEERAPESPELTEIWPRISWLTTLESEPSGARVFRKVYDDDTDAWIELGRTPLIDIRIPYGLSQLRFELEGYRPLLRVVGGAHVNWTELAPGNDPDHLLVGPQLFRLDTEESLPTDMVRVPGWSLVVSSDTLQMRDFFLGRHEVDNADYRSFMDVGGYERPELWSPIVVRGDTLPWETAMALFVDRTGRPGPSTWEAGDYRAGEEDSPVSGVSWYEADAYARYAGRELPTAFHLGRGLANAMFPWLLPASNFSRAGPRPVADGHAMSFVGAFDLAGNVREWTSSRLGDARLILGGSWNDPYYTAGTEDASAPPEDRSPGNGIRLARTFDEPTVAERVRAPIPRTTATPAVVAPPVSDTVYAAYARVFDYDRLPLGDSVEAIDTTRLWTRERVSFDAAYGPERVALHLYLPRNADPPYQTVVYWPGWDTFFLDDVDVYFSKQLDFVVKSGRAVAFPVYRGTFQRRVGEQRRRPDFGTSEYRDNTVHTVKDLRRTLDYLETRPDIDRDTFAFFGYSWGGVNGPVVLAQESRFRAAVIYIGLLPDLSATPEVDPMNALPRVRAPTLMFSGEFDPIVPLENAARYFDLIGVAPELKRHVIAIGGHFIPRPLLIRETLDWMDHWIGPAD